MSDRSDERAAERAWFAELERLIGAPVIGAGEAEDVLELARVVAHTSERRFAPLTAYVAALTLAGASTEERRARLRGLVRALEEQDRDGRRTAGTT